MNKITIEDVEKICILVKEGHPYTKIAEKFGILRQYVSLINCGKVYPEIAKKYNLSQKRPKILKLSEDQLKEICQMMIDGYTNREISEKVNIQSGDSLEILGGDLEEWILFKKISTGEEGWLYVNSNQCMLPDGSMVYSEKVFEGLAFFD